jgi:hypothetical protein
MVDNKGVGMYINFLLEGGAFFKYALDKSASTSYCKIWTQLYGRMCYPSLIFVNCCKRIHTHWIWVFRAAVDSLLFDMIAAYFYKEVVQ